MDVQAETEIRLTSMMTTVVGSFYLPFMWHMCPGCLSLQCVCAFSETTAEVGTIAGIVSAVAMALVGAISSYISYQKKKLCFSIQRKAVATQ